MWIVIGVAVLSAIGAAIVRVVLDPYSRLMLGDMPVIGVILAAALIIIVAAANVLGWIRVSGFLSAQTIGFRIFVIVCVAVLFAMMSAIALVILIVVMYPLV